MSQYSDYFKNRGDEPGKLIASGMEAAERDGYKFSEETALKLGAKEKNIAALSNAIKSDSSVKYLGITGYLYLIENDSTEMIGYVSALRSMQNAIDDEKWNRHEDR